MRVTMQCGREGSVRHNTHQHIESGERNVIFRDFTGAARGTDARESELAFYKSKFGPALEQQNERHRQTRHRDRLRTMEQVYTAKRTRPEEVILQVGKKGETVSPKAFQSLIQDFFKKLNKWNRDHGSPFKTLNTAIHLDESTPHLHWRRVWLYEEDGISHIGQEEALKRAGVALPNRFEAEGRYNNRKMNFDDLVRRTWQAVCREHGLDIETEPLPTKKHKTVAEYKDVMLSEEVSRLEAQISRLRGQIDDLSDVKTQTEESVKESSNRLETINIQIDTAHRELDALIRRREELVSRDEAARRAGRDLSRSMGFTGKDYHPGR
jgi:hypothetical protein